MAVMAPVSPDVVALARRSFIRTGRIDMGELAIAAGVNRSTLYRRYTSRDRLLGEVIWSLAEPALERSVGRARGSGGNRIAQILGDFAEQAVSDGPFFQLLRRDLERALRVTTTKAGGVAQRIVDRVEELVVEEVGAGALELVLSPADTSFLLVRITESFIYTGAISGEEPDVSKVPLACRALLGSLNEVGGA